jgi:hypothetical protein
LRFSVASLTLSLAFISKRSFPEAPRAKPYLAAALILAGCGGGGNANWQQVKGNGFSFNAPSAWTVEDAAATNGDVDRVEVAVFRLVRAYEPARRAAVGRELDRVAARVAAQLKGSVRSRRSLEAGGLDARSYVIDFDGKTEEITFALDGRREYQLLCRRTASGDDAPCVELLRSFHVG